MNDPVLAKLYCRTIDMVLNHFKEVGSPLLIPTANNKSYYLKTCWLLAHYKKLQQKLERLNEPHLALSLNETIKLLPEYLPVLKASNL